jgi:hypothetical protein
VATDGPHPQAPAEDPDVLALVRGEPALAAATAELAAAAAPARPAILMRRARAALLAARKTQTATGRAFGFSPVVEREQFLAYCGLAIRDLEELLEAHPQAADAPEAMFTLGAINDFPNLNLFDEALVAYRLTVERYPGTPWAVRARERMALIEQLTGGKTGEGRAPAP